MPVTIRCLQIKVYVSKSVTTKLASYRIFSLKNLNKAWEPWSFVPLGPLPCEGRERMKKGQLFSVSTRYPLRGQISSAYALASQKRQREPPRQNTPNYPKPPEPSQTTPPAEPEKSGSFRKGKSFLFPQVNPPPPPPHSGALQPLSQTSFQLLLAGRPRRMVWGGRREGGSG